MEEHKKELNITVNLNTSIENAFRSWTDEKLLAHWWGPFGVTTPECEVDFKVGGRIHLVMLAGNELGDLAGVRWPIDGEIRDIIIPSRYVFVSSAIINDVPIMDTLNIIKLNPIDENHTELDLHVEVTRLTPEAEGPLSGMEQGWNQSIDKLQKFVETL